MRVLTSDFDPTRTSADSLASSQSANLSMDNLFKGEAIAWNGHFSSHGGADALVRLECADG